MYNEQQAAEAPTAVVSAVDITQTLETFRQSLTELVPNAKSDNPTQEAYCQYYDLSFDGCTQSFGWLKSDHHQLFTHIVNNPAQAGTVLYLHGYTDHSANGQKLWRHLTQKGLSIAAIDFPGLGLSSGERGVIDDFREYMKCLEQLIAYSNAHLPKPLYLIGHSMGGAVAQEFLFHHRVYHPFEKIILLAPLVRVKNLWQNQLKFHATKRFVQQVDRDFSDNSCDETFKTFIQHHDPLQLHQFSTRWFGAYLAWHRRYQTYGQDDTDIIVLQGDQDATLDWEDGLYDLEKKFPNAVVEILPKAKHHLANESAEKRKVIFEKILTYMEC